MAEGGEKRDPKSHRTPSQIKRHYRTYQGKPEQIRKRAERNKARAMLKKEGVDVEGKDVHHKRPMRSGGTSSRKNLTVTSVKKNRGWRKKKS